MQTALRARLLANTGVSNLVATRIDWGVRPQGKALPAITLNLISDAREYHMGGADGTQQSRVQIDVFANSYKSADDVRNAIIACLEPASGNFQGSFLIRNADLQDTIDTGVVHRASMDFKITYSA